MILSPKTQPTYSNDEFCMNVLNSVVQQLSGITIHHQFRKPDEAGFENAERWGYLIRAALPSTVFRSWVPPHKLANALRDAFAAAGYADDKIVVCTDAGVWIDGAVVSEFIKSISKPEAPAIDNAKALDYLREEGKSQGLTYVDQQVKAIEMDWNLPAARAFMASIKGADFSKGGRKI